MKTAQKILRYALWLPALSIVTVANAQSKVETNGNQLGCDCFAQFIECLTGNGQHQDIKPSDMKTIESLYAANVNPSNGNTSNGGCNMQNNGWDNAISNGNNPPAIMCVAQYVLCCQQSGC